jgi:hypothetical protein
VDVAQGMHSACGPLEIDIPQPQHKQAERYGVWRLTLTQWTGIDTSLALLRPRNRISTLLLRCNIERIADLVVLYVRSCAHPDHFEKTTREPTM